MNTTLQPHYVGVVLGSFLMLIHTGWSILHALGFAEPLVKWIFAMHMFALPFTFFPFSFLTALELIILTGVIGYFVGQLFARMWNQLAV